MEDLTEEVKELKRFKNRSGWSFDKIAIKLGVSSQTVRNWFKRRNSPTPLCKKAIEEFLVRIPEASSRV